MSLKQQLTMNFELFESSLNGSANLPMNQIRRTAMQKFVADGFPTKKDEEWKYTNLQPVLQKQFELAKVEKSGKISREDVGKFQIPDLEATTLVFLNGFFAPELSTVLSQKNGVIISGFAEAQKQNSALVQEYFDKISDKNSSLAVLNTALALDGAFIFVPEGENVEFPVVILNISDARAENIFAQTRNLVLSQKNSSVKIVEISATLGENTGFLNSMTEIFAGENSSPEYFAVQNDSKNSVHIATTDILQEQNSRFSATTITLGGGFVRNNLHTTLNGEHCESHFYGLSALGENQHADNHTLVNHAKPHCESNELYKAILDGNSTGVFNGKILVAKDAQKTNAYQSNKTILLSRAATMNTKPQLEIFADDVKCSHGATIGQLDEEAVFYLRSRGLDSNQATALLTSAFANEILEKISIESLKIFLKHAVEMKTRSEN